MVLRLFFSALTLISVFSIASAQNEGCKSVEIPVGIVNGNGEAFRGLAAQDFSGHVGKTVLPLKAMTYDEGPRRIVIVADTSKKLSGETRKVEQMLIQTLLEAARPEDSLALITARGPEKVVKFGEERAAYLQALPQEGESRHGKEVGVLDAAMQGMDLFGDPKPGDSIILIAADLEGNHNTNPRRLAKALQDHHVRLFGLALGPVSIKNPARSGQSTTAWGLALETPGIGEIGYNTGDEDFFPLTRNSGGLVMGVVNSDYQHSYSLKDPKVEARIKQQARSTVNMIAAYYRVQLEPHSGSWSLEPAPSVHQAVPNMFLLYPRELGCSNEPHMAQK